MRKIFILLLILPYLLAVNNVFKCNNFVKETPASLLASAYGQSDEPLAEEYNRFFNKTKPTSCLPFGNSSDIHEIHLKGFKTFKARCDSQLGGPGWMVIQRRFNGSVDFYRNWTEYRDGFGDLNGEFWLGLEQIHRLTKNRPHEVLLYFTNFDNLVNFTIQDNFEIGDEADNYKIVSVGSVLGNQWLGLFEGSQFSTSDHHKRENNEYTAAAEAYHSAWWYGTPVRHNANGKYYENPVNKTDGMWSYVFGENSFAISYLKSTQILIRPKLTRRLFSDDAPNNFNTWNCETKSELRKQTEKGTLLN